jgi:membrane protein DedA with SNARE-associated domain
MEESITNFILNLFTSLGYAGIVVAMAIESCCIPLPSELIMPLAGFLAYQGKFNVWLAGIAGAFGCLLGSVVAYWIGATGGRPLLLRYGRYILVSQHDADLADRYFARYGEITIFVTRLMPIVRTFISLPAGIARMNFARFSLYTFLGSLPWCWVLAWAGYTLGAHWKDVGATIRKYDYVVLVVVVVLVALYIYRHVRRSQVTMK